MQRPKIVKMDLSRTPRQSHSRLMDQNEFSARDILGEQVAERCAGHGQGLRAHPKGGMTQVPLCTLDKTARAAATRT